MQIEYLGIDKVVLIKTDSFSDHRGEFTRLYCDDNLSFVTNGSKIVQINSSFNIQKGTLRGLHYQKNPLVDAKFVRCIKGSIYDVLLDIRKDSKSKGKWLSQVLDSESKHMIYVPPGFAHGFQTLEDNTEVLYLHTESYLKQLEAGYLFSSPELSIPWPLKPVNLSKRDLLLPSWSKNSNGIEIE